MRSIAVTLSMLITFSASFAQIAVNSVNENFNSSCALSTLPSQWSLYTPVPGTIPNGEWTCSPAGGRPTSTGASTPGIECTSVWSSAYHLDTSYFISPLIDFSTLSPKPSNIFFNFDSKVSKIYLGGRLDIITKPISDTTQFYGANDSIITSFAVPLINEGDSSNWVTHQINISSKLYAGGFYIAFRYIGTDTTGSVWYLDNINTTTIKLGVSNLSEKRIFLTVNGPCSSSAINIAYTSDAGRKYELCLFDMMGRQIYKETITGKGGLDTYAINHLNLIPGMYIIKLGDGYDYSTARAIVR